MTSLGTTELHMISISLTPQYVAVSCYLSYLPMWLYLYSYISYLGNMLECCILRRTATCTVVYQDLSPSRKVGEGLAIVTSMHGLLTNQILLFNFETVLITLASVCKTFLEGERGHGFLTVILSYAYLITSI